MNEKGTFLHPPNFFMSCNDNDKELDALKNKVTELEVSLSQLKEAFLSNKTITTVNYTKDSGYDIVFSDGTIITLKNGSEGITPIVKIDSDGYWTVSYDFEKTFNRILDESGNPVIAVPEDNSTCVRVATDEDGNYVFEIYAHSSPDEVIKTIKTPISSDPAVAIASIVKEENNGSIILTMQDGSEFRFNLDVSYPTSIVVLNEKVAITALSNDTIFFRLNPSNAFINFIIDGENPNIELDAIPSRADEFASYTNPSVEFRIDSVFTDKTPEGIVKQGQFCAIVEVLSHETLLSERICLVVTTKNSNGETIRISSTPFTISYVGGNEIDSVSIAGVAGEKTDNIFHVQLPPSTDLSALTPTFSGNFVSIAIKHGNTCVSDFEKVDFSNPVSIIASDAAGNSREYVVVITFSNLPIIYINTTAPIVNKYDWVQDNTIQIYNAGEYNSTYTVSIKGRGNSTWYYDKKPYAIKLDKKASVLGMPAHKRWCLLAEYCDPGIVRNNIAYYIGREISTLDWSPRTSMAEVVINGKYNGLYLVTEQIKIDKNRVNVGDDGFVLEIDDRAYFPDETDPYFRINHIERPIAVKDYDEKEGSLAYIEDYLTKADALLFSENYLDSEHGWKSMFDMESFVEWYLIKEITKDEDGAFFSSCYMNLKRGDKLKMGPLWDFDLSMGNYFQEDGDPDSNNPEGFKIKNVEWYQRMFTDPEFVALVKQRFSVYYNSQEKIYSQIDQIEAATRDAYKGEIDLWRPSHSTDPYEYRKARIDYLKNWLKQRFEWLKTAYDNL